MANVPGKVGIEYVDNFLAEVCIQRESFVNFVYVSEVPELYFWDINIQFGATWILHLVHHLVY
jgi:hypothetical protein